MRNCVIKFCPDNRMKQTAYLHARVEAAKQTNAITYYYDSPTKLLYLEI